MLINSKEYKEAKSVYENVLKILPADDKNYLYFWGEANLQIAESDLGLGNRDVAMKTLLMLINGSSEHKVRLKVAARAVAGLQRCYASRAEQEKITNVLNELWDKHKNDDLTPGILLLIAFSKERSDPAKAIEMYQEVIKAFPNRSEAKYAERCLELLEQTVGTLPKKTKDIYEWTNDGGPYGCWVNYIAVDPKNSDIAYACGIGGFFKTTDGGMKWKETKILPKDGVETSISCVAVDVNDSNILYVGGGELYKSADKGETWMEIGEKSGIHSINCIALDPMKSGTVYIAVNGEGIFKSIDGGEHWERKSNGLAGRNFRHLIIDAVSPKTMYAVSRTRAGLYESKDGGKKWELKIGSTKTISVKDLTKIQDSRREAIYQVTLVNSSNPNIEYVYQGSANSNYWNQVKEASAEFYPGGLLINPVNAESMQITICSHDGVDVSLTRDGGENWRILELPFDEKELGGIRVDPKQNNILYAGTMSDVYHYSDDDGKTWQFYYSKESDPDEKQSDTLKTLKELFSFGLEYDDIWYFDRKFLATHASNRNVLYFPEQGDGVHKTTDGGKTWFLANKGIVSNYPHAIVCSRVELNVVYMATMPSGIFKSVDGGKSWERIVRWRGYGKPFAAHPTDPKLLLISRDNNTVVMSTDGGMNWKDVPGISGHPNGFVFDPVNPDKFYAMTDKGIAATDDHGSTWEMRTVFAEENIGKFDLIKQYNSDIIYCVGKDGILRSTDVGLTWESTASYGENAGFRYACVNPSDSKTIVVCLADRLIKSNDAGREWETVIELI